MPGRWRERLAFTRGLGFRLALLLSVAILPIGLISLSQTLDLSREATRTAEQALLGRTAAAAAGERALLQTALGSADALGTAVLETMATGSVRNCMDMMTGFVNRSSIYSFAGFVQLDGHSPCNSSGDPQDLTRSGGYQLFLREPGTHIFATTHAQVTGDSVVFIQQPVYDQASLIGYVALAITHDLLRSTHGAALEQAEDRLLTFSGSGDVLSYYTADHAASASLLPADISLAELARGPQTTFHATSSDGQERVFSVVPIVPGLAYALGSYALGDSGIAGFRLANVSAILFTLALFLVSLAVAYYAVDHLVLRHVRELRGQMRRFAVGDRSQVPRVMREAPTEIADVSQTFQNMARILMRDEEELERAVTEKTVLLKEVHHRVRNNLQLIASIISMQNRLLADPEAKAVLRSVQDRVASLATIYRNLYQAEHLDAVEAGRLIGDIVQQMLVTSGMTAGQLAVETAIMPLTLQPDQAVPLSLLATEGFTNAIKYSGTPEGAAGPWVRVALQPDGADHVVLDIANSLGPADPARPGSESTGLGSQLIEAFATQLNGEAEVLRDAVSHRLRVRFRTEDAPGPANAGVGSGEAPAVRLTSAPRSGVRH